jgi:hypothetical protein
MDYERYERDAMRLLSIAAVQRKRLILHKDGNPDIIYKDLQSYTFRQLKEMAWFVGNFLLDGYDYDLTR